MSFLRTNLAYFMDRQGLTQDQVAKVAGITQPNIGRFLKGTTEDLKASSAAALARHFGVSLDDLIGHDFRSGEPSAKNSHADLDLQALSSALVALDKTMKALNVPYRQVQDMAPTLRYAYKHLVRHPDMPNSERALFDDALIGKMRGDLDAATAGTERRPAARNRGGTKGAAP